MSEAAGEITLEALPERALPLASEPRLQRGRGGARVIYRNEIPYFWWLWSVPLWVRARTIERAVDAGRSLPRSAPFWAPPVAMDAVAISTVSVVCLYTLCLTYAGGTGGLLTNTLPYAADLLDSSDHALGVGLAVVRVGVLLAFGLALVADRRGRRALIVGGALAHCGLAALLGLAPTFEVYIGGHVLLRALNAGLSIALVVIALEAVPAANRAVTLSLVLLATGTGAALGVIGTAARGRRLRLPGLRRHIVPNNALVFRA